MIRSGTDVPPPCPQAVTLNYPTQILFYITHENKILKEIQEERNYEKMYPNDNRDR